MTQLELRAVDQKNALSKFRHVKEKLRKTDKGSWFDILCRHI